MGQQADLVKVERELGYRPTISLEQGISEIISYRKINPVPPASLSY
jgi:nucleoside-diphosphate-sugar epimerase